MDRGRSQAPFAHPAGLDMKSDKASLLPFTLGSGVLAFLLLAANLRPALTAVGPVLDEVRSSLALSGTAAGLLSTLPLMIFAGFSPVAPRVQAAVGLERTLAGCLVLIVAGIVVRSQGSAAALFVGTVIFATGIAVANVLVPSLIKRDFPHRIEAMTTAYLLVMSLTAAVSTGIAAPLSASLPGGWRSSLAVWAVPALLALACWLPLMRTAGGPVPAVTPEGATKPLWRSAMAWHITAFMGLQSLFFYVLVAWLPVFLADHGVSPAESGLLLTLFQAVSFAVGFAVPVLLRRVRDQRPLAVAPSLVTVLCIIGLTVAPQFAVLWLVISGISIGCTFILAFAFIGLRTADHRQAAALSAMAQSAGYLIAAIGPVAFGALHDLTADWAAPMASLAAAVVIQAAAGLGAGRPGYV
jgi:CP family cyanate transporter-like MFS transporter